MHLAVIEKSWDAILILQLPIFTKRMGYEHLAYLHTLSCITSILVIYIM